MRDEFIAAIAKNQEAFKLELPANAIGKLADYFEMVIAANPLLHLVAPCSPQEFATRHILESLTLLEYLPIATRFADVGTGAGLPGVPCLIARRDLSGVLIESKEKKTRFLETVLDHSGLSSRTVIINRQFSETGVPDVSHVTSRALDKFLENLPRLLKWGVNRQFLLFGGNSLRKELQKRSVRFQERLMPLSDQRFLFIFQAAD